jgi:hypothetical protein
MRQARRTTRCSGSSRADDDRACWNAQWLIDLPELPALLGVRPVRSELIYLLVSLDKQFTAEAPGEPWET